MKVLIVDDEPRICTLLEQLIEWDRLGLTPAGIAHSANSAYDLIVQNRPDIVITDIRMSGKNGLDLVEKAKAHFPHIYFVVISGYKEFDFLYRAIQLGVEDFLLKPIQREDLNTILSRICTQVAVPPKDEYPRDQGAISRDRNLFFMELLVSLWAPQSWTIPDINSKYGFSFQHGIFQIVHIRIKHPEYIKKDYIDFLNQLTLDGISIFSSACYDAEYNYSRKGDIYILLNYSPEQQDAIAALLKKLHLLVQNLCRIQNISQYVVGVGYPYEELQKLPLSFHTARYAARSCMLLGANRLYLAQNMLPSNYNPPSPYRFLDITFRNELAGYMSTFDSEPFLAQLKEKFSQCPTAFADDPGVCPDVLDTFLDWFYSSLEKNKMLTEYSSQNKVAAISAIDNSFSFKQAMDILLLSVSNELSQICSQQEPKQHQAITIIKQYVYKNYNKPITLEMLATLTYMNPAYLSVLFKNRTGENFSDFLLSVRIENAKIFLKDMQNSISQVAAMVGFKDAKYFSKVFTNATGLHPKEYRQLCKAHLD